MTGRSCCKFPWVMTKSKRFPLLVGFVGTLFILLSYNLSSGVISEAQRFINSIKSYRQHLHPDEPDIPLLRQKMRKQQLQEMCDSGKDVSSKQRRSLDKLSDNELNHFIVDDKHSIIYCFIPKVACTNWKKVMFLLQQNMSYQDLQSVSGKTVHNREKLKYLNSFSPKERKMRLEEYTKFLFVRDPFVRLVSAYRNKFLKHDDYFYKYYGRLMLQLYGKMPAPPLTEDEAFPLGIRPSFNNFIQYLLDPRTEIYEPFEPHWRQMHRLCLPCIIDYDFIGHQESLQEDAYLLLKMLKLEDVIKFPLPPQNMTAADSVLDWFHSVSLDDRRKLYKLYEEDFRLFGYRKPEELLQD